MFGLILPKGLFSYSVMPQVVPRMRDLFMSGFHYIPFFIAVVYQMVGLLPRSHPYLNQNNIGLYGIRHVVSEAARNVTFSLRNIDQIFIFFAVIIGLILFMVQFLSLAMLLFLQPAMAIPTTWVGFFTVSPANKPHDLAYIMLDMIFGVPHPETTSLAPLGFFESCVSTSVNCVDNFGVATALTTTAGTGVTPATAQLFGPFTPLAYQNFPFPYHLGIHRLLSIYSNGLLVIAVMITCYFIVTILAETAQSGTPFGKRFNKTWAPLRIVIAFGLLVPLTSGINSSQYIVLYAAKIGSAFASNGWVLFNGTLAESVGGSNSMISTPNAPDVSSLLQFLYVAKTCKYIHDFYERVRVAQAPTAPPPTPARLVEAYALFEHSNGATNSLLLDTGQDYDSMIVGLADDASSVTIRFGIRDEVRFPERRSFVSPVCGEITLSFQDARDSPIFGGDAEPGADWMQYTYYQIWWHIWHDTSTFMAVAGSPGPPPHPAESITTNRRDYDVAFRTVEGLKADVLPAVLAANQVKLDSVYVNNVKEQVKQRIESGIISAVTGQQATNRVQGTAVDPNIIHLQRRGWAGAGIWYNRIAEMNGMVVSSAFAVPIVAKYPAVMEKVIELKAKHDKDIDATTVRKPVVTGVNSLETLLGNERDSEFATALYQAEYEWSSGGLVEQDLTGNAFLDAISALLGLNGLYDLRKNVGTHPLAMLVGVGRALVESAVRSLGYAALGTTLGAAGVGGALGGIAANFFISVAMMGLTVGFVLFYVVPFLPFIYFFFAVGGWLKGIFEAMVGAPLWALAHIRIDGHGMPGNAAINGYFLIFEVFLRPILTLFGLLASISIFSALVEVLNSIFSIVTENVGGYDMESELAATAATSTSENMRSKIDEFFFTVIYAIIVYLIAMSSFKLIDTIPNNILRWMGQSVATFGDQREDPAQGLVSKTTVGSQQALSKIGGGLHSVVKGAAG